MRTANERVRIIIFVGVAIATVLWGISFVPAIRLWGNPHTSGMQWIPAFFATPIYLLLVMPALALGIAGRPLGLKIAAGLEIAATVAALVIFGQ